MEQDRLDKFMTLVVGASRSVTRLKAKHMTEYGLGSTHTMCLRQLYSSPEGLTRTQLAERCELDKAQVSRIVGELSECGCIAEGQAKSNYKRRIILTDDGRRIAEDINQIVLRINRFVSGTLTDEEISTFYKVFGQICENLREAEENFDKDIQKGT